MAQRASAGDDISPEPLHAGMRSRQDMWSSPTGFDSKETADFDRLGGIFRKNRLDRKLKRKHIAGMNPIMKRSYLI